MYKIGLVWLVALLELDILHFLDSVLQYYWLYLIRIDSASYLNGSLSSCHGDAGARCDSRLTLSVSGYRCVASTMLQPRW